MEPTDSTLVKITEGPTDDDNKNKNLGTKGKEINPSKNKDLENSTEKKEREGISNFDLSTLSFVAFAAISSTGIILPFLGVIMLTAVLDEFSHRVFGKSLIALGKSLLIALGKSIISVFNKINEKRKERKEKKQLIKPLIGSTEKVVGSVQVGQTGTVLEQKTIQTQTPSYWKPMTMTMVVRNSQALARANVGANAMKNAMKKGATDAIGVLPSKLRSKTSQK
jgi:hypothetical protein